MLAKGRPAPCHSKPTPLRHSVRHQPGILVPSQLGSRGPLLRLAHVLCSGRADGFLWGVSLSQSLVSLNRITDSPSEANPATDMLTGATTQGLKCDLLGRFHWKVWISVFMGKSEALTTPNLHFTRALRNLWSPASFSLGHTVDLAQETPSSA